MHLFRHVVVYINLKEVNWALWGFTNIRDITKKCLHGLYACYCYASLEKNALMDYMLTIEFHNNIIIYNVLCNTKAH